MNINQFSKEVASFIKGTNEFTSTMLEKTVTKHFLNTVKNLIR